MTAATSLIPGLDDIVRHGAPERRNEAARRIADLFFEDASTLRPRHLDLFDGLLIDLVPHTDMHARVDLAERLSRLTRAPRALIGRLARDNEIMVAGPLLRRSPVLDDDVLLEIANANGQSHLLAMSERASLSPELTDVLVRRGDRNVIRRAASNDGAQFSPSGYSELIGRARDDGVLTLAVGRRADLPDPHLKSLLVGARNVLRRRLGDVVKPERQAKIERMMAEFAGKPVPGAKPVPVAGERHFAPAQRTVLALYLAGGLNERALRDFAKGYRYEEAVAALAAMSGLEIATLDRLVSGPRHDPVLIIGRTIGLDWSTVHALILMRIGPKRIPAQADIMAARLAYARLVPTTAERVVVFWKSRH
jgi:uncharacterized protein (DUF2336 family)